MLLKYVQVYYGRALVQRPFNQSGIVQSSLNRVTCFNQRHLRGKGFFALTLKAQTPVILLAR